MSVHPVDYSADLSAPPPPPAYASLAQPGEKAPGNLEALRGKRHLVLHQILDMLEAVTYIDQPNKYKLMDEHDNLIYSLEEKPTGSHVAYRDFDVIARDGLGQVCFNVTRPSKPCAMCCFCCAGCDKCQSEAKVMQHGQQLGKLKQRISFSVPKFKVKDEDDDHVYDIEGESACCTPSTEYNFINKKDDKEATIHKGGGGMGFGQNVYNIEFKEDISPQRKALIIGCLILFDYRFHFNARAPPQHRRR